MMNYFVIFIFLIVSFVDIFSQEKTHTFSVIPQIRDVTVFLNGTEQSSTAKVNLQSGSNEIIFENISPYINQNSVQLKALNNNVNIVSVNIQNNFLKDKEVSGKLKVVSDSLDEINLKVAIRQSHIKVYNDERDMILSNKKIGGNQTLVTDDLDEMADYFRKRLLEIEMKLIDANRQLSDFQKIQSRLLAQEKVLKSGSIKSTVDILVNVSSTTKQTVEFELNYVVNNAGWVPKYDLRASDLEKPIILNFKADVYNTTGFDWNNVNVTLSTGNPSVDNTQPTINPWYIQYYNAYNKKTSYAYSGSAPAPSRNDFEDNRALSEVTVMSKEIQKSATRSSTTMANFTSMIESTVNNQFKISVPYTIKSDAKPSVVAIQNYELPVMYKYMTIPKIDNDAFLLARMTGWENLNLLPGDANIYFEGTFVGISYIETNSTSDTLELSMGRDKNIVIKREKVEELCRNTVVGGNKRSMRAYEITIKNNKSKEIEIDVFDQIPLSSFKEVVIELQDQGGATYNDKTGELKWTIRLKPGESKKVQFKYQVKYPKDINLTTF